MATIQENIDRIASAKTSLAASISAKGVDVPSSTTIDGYAALVDQISTGSTGSSENRLNKLLKNEITAITQADLSGLTYIPAYAFYGKSGFTTVDIPTAVTSINTYAFYSCSTLSDVTIPNTVATVDSACVAECAALTSLTIGSGITCIGPGAFVNNRALTRIDIKFTGMPTSTGANAFDNTNNCPIYVPAEGYTTFKTWWSEYAARYKVDNSIMYISTDGSAVTPYDATVFGATLTSNPYSDGVGILAFDAAPTSIGASAFRSCSTLASITIPSTVTSIGDNAFRGCGLTSISIPNTVTSMGLYALASNHSLNYVTIGSGLTSISNFMFNSCTGLTSFTIPSTITSIGNGAFNGCEGLTAITIPSGITSIGDSAFNGCIVMTEINVDGDTPATLGANAFDSTNNCPIYVPSASVSTYIAASGWSNYASRIQAQPQPAGGDKIYYTSSDGNTVTPYTAGTAIFGAEITANTYSGGQGVIYFDGNVTLVGANAFKNCTTLQSITLPETITSMSGTSIFGGCTALTGVTIPTAVTSIGTSTFSGCTSLTSMVIPDNVVQVSTAGLGATFRGCTSLTSVTIGNGITGIGNQLFNGCTALETISFGGGITNMATGATSISRATTFSGCTAVTSITCYATAVPTTSEFSFTGLNTGLVEVYVPSESVESYEADAVWFGLGPIQAIP